MAIGSIKIVSWAALLLLAASVSASAAAAAVPHKYEFVTSDTKVEDGHKLTRVRLISGGALGGYIESESNLSQAGSCFLDEQSRAYGDARITDDAQLHGLARELGAIVRPGESLRRDLRRRASERRRGRLWPSLRQRRCRGVRLRPWTSVRRRQSRRPRAGLWNRLRQRQYWRRRDGLRGKAIGPRDGTRLAQGRFAAPRRAVRT